MFFINIYIYFCYLLLFFVIYLLTLFINEYPASNYESNYGEGLPHEY